ncbi:hypothetical protein SAMN05216167_1328 [Spirosoma endophyticum]|uniref:Uncharacterized protein n=1 Tax=Spirosoma endophyticum TaxID=662367 RepID=A0A1I2GHM6_9BACT|nr:hypothetical protein SAMN05216167_1328 [Spirosoma endophyticum]
MGNKAWEKVAVKNHSGSCPGTSQNHPGPTNEGIEVPGKKLTDNNDDLSE